MFKKLLFLTIICVATIMAKPQNEVEIDRIVGGSETPKWQSKFVVLFKRRIDGKNFCSGSLVAGNKVLTSASCVSKILFQNVIAVLYTLSPVVPDRDAVTKRVTRVLVHPNYNSKYKTWDLGIVTLDSPVDFTSIPIDYDINLNGATLIALGWGYYDPPGIQKLVSAGVQTIQPQVCARIYNTITFDANYNICLQSNGIASCTTDQGGPIISSSGYLIGVNSVSGCRPGQPFIAVRLRGYADWIKNNI